MVARIGKASRSIWRSGRGQRSARHRAWVAVAVLIAAGGVATAVVAARAVARSDAATARQSFETSSAQVASTLQLSIQRQDDVVVSAGAFVAGNPGTTSAEFIEWFSMVQGARRYPELQGLAFVTMVPASKLAAYTARAESDRATLYPPGKFVVVPPGVRPFYCFVQALAFWSPQTEKAPSGYDICEAVPGSRQTFLATRDSGRGSYVPDVHWSEPLLIVDTPIYRGGDVPTTLAGRREAFVGQIATAVAPRTVLDAALRGHAKIAVRFAYHAGASNAVFHGGSAPDGARSVTIDLHNGWTVQTFAALPTAAVMANGAALALLLIGAGLSLLLGTFVFVLATGRARAVRLVADRTGQLHHQALHDALTGLPNRALIADRIEQLLARNRRQGTQGAVLFIDLDEFKNVNDTLGHGAGDQLLVAVAARLTSTVRDAETIGRMGGDEFVVLIDGCELDVTPELVAKRFLDVMRQPFQLDESTLPLNVHTSIGIAVGDRVSAADLLRDADIALYEAKAAGKNRFATFHPQMQTAISRRSELEFELRSALADDQYHLVYQPTYDLDGPTLIGVEALLRWDHPTHGLRQPDEFIPILEQTGEINEVGRWVLREACEQMATWHSRGDILDISVNISARQLDTDAIIDHIRDALESSGLAPTSLIIEVSETALMRNAGQTARRLQAIKDLGVRIAVDDFGTGYSSLAYLQQFPIDSLKIDRAFTSAITSSPESRALVGTLVQLGKDVGLTTLAEGVETIDQIDELRLQHVNAAQGFLLSRPLDPSTLETKILRPGRTGPSSSARP